MIDFEKLISAMGASLLLMIGLVLIICVFCLIIILLNNSLWLGLVAVFLFCFALFTFLFYNAI